MVKAATPEAVDLFHRGAVAFAQVERNGIKIDEGYLDRQIEETGKRIKEMTQQIKDHKVFKRWKKRFGSKTAMGNPQQLEKIIFDDLGYKRTGRTTEKTKQNKADISAFEFVVDKEPFVKMYFDLRKLEKARTTYLLGIKREVQNGYTHPVLNLHTAITYRSSANNPPIHQFPIRDPIQGELIRRCVIAPHGYRIGEIDFGGIEVCVSACYHKDPMMIKYIEDPSTDMHRDMAMQCYMLKKKEVTKNIRYCAKNKYVFPEFYGSYWYDCSKNLWEAIQLMDLQTEAGVPLKKHLKKQGIRKLGDKISDHETGRIATEPGTFMDHIRLVEKDFWGKRFQVYAQWKKDFWKLYCKRGWFPFKTGFVGKGLFDRKQVCNSPIQGSAFHLLLWSLIELQEWLNKKKMRTKIISEIHDSLLIYFHEDEIDEVLAKAKWIMTKKILKYHKWIVVPLSIEAEVADIGGSWADKKKVEIA